MIHYDAAENLRLFIKACGVGFLLGAVHCVLGIIFGGKKKNNALKTAEDIVFAVFACTVTFMFLLDANNGFFRAFIALGEGIGFLLFLLFPEQPILALDDKIRSKTAEKTEKLRARISDIYKKRSKKRQTRIRRREIRRKK